MLPVDHLATGVTDHAEGEFLGDAIRSPAEPRYDHAAITKLHFPIAEPPISLVSLAQGREVPCDNSVVERLQDTASAFSDQSRIHVTDGQVMEHVISPADRRPWP